ncbi:hypothetical protein [Acrocarpospora catenulata]|uniref:hypothetical protein n=1 Tax=Acrocarpospora catenulata TaxID=2836182 RepID=UPI001BD9C69C|nr:hypothetical protein [Acrocarpospora catenulata]
MDGCRNLLRVRVTGLPQGVPLASSTGRRGRLTTVEEPTARLGTLVFVVDGQAGADA